MTRKVLIAPVGYYEERLFSSIMSIGPDTVYLLKGDDAYKKVTEIIVKSLNNRLPKYVKINDERKVNFSDVVDIYKNFVEIIKLEENKDDNVQIFVDVTSAPRLSTFAATHLGQLFNIVITYTGSQVNLTPIDDADDFLAKKQDARKDHGIKPRQYKTHYRSLDVDEKNLLLTLVSNKKFNSINELMCILEKTKKEKITSKRQKHWSRIINRLETYQILETIELDGNKKSVSLTDVGMGISKGLFASKTKS